jgi:hypothetical protein
MPHILIASVFAFFFYGDVAKHIAELVTRGD